MNKVIIALSLVALLTGCDGPQSAMNREAALQKKVDAMEARISELESNQVLALQGVAMITNNVNEQNTKLAQMLVKVLELKDGFDTIDGALGRIENATTNKSKTPPRVAYASPAVSSPRPPLMIQGVPATIYGDIRNAAEKEWPNDYSMQVFKINHELEAYKKLHPYSTQ